MQPNTSGTQENRRCKRGHLFVAYANQQNSLRCCGHVLRKQDTDRVKNCVECEVEGSRPRGRPKRTWREVVQKDCQARNLNRVDAMDRSRWKKLIKIGWVNVSFGTGLPGGLPGWSRINGCCCCCICKPKRYHAELQESFPWPLISVENPFSEYTRKYVWWFFQHLGSRYKFGVFIVAVPMVLPLPSIHPPPLELSNPGLQCKQIQWINSRLLLLLSSS